MWLIGVNMGILLDRAVGFVRGGEREVEGVRRCHEPWCLRFVAVE